MSVAVNAPGVYARINNSGSRPMEGSGAAIPGFIGQSKVGEINKPILVTNWGQFEKSFGTFEDSPYLAHAVYGFFANGGTSCYVSNIGEAKEGQNQEELVGDVLGEDKGPEKRTGLNVFNSYDDISLILAPGFTNKLIQEGILDYCERVSGRFAILDGEENLEGNLSEAYRPKAAENGAIYFPWVNVYDPFKKTTVVQPPSGYVAGLYSKVDGKRGIHKAPANEQLVGIAGLKYSLTRAEQAHFNPRGINLIRDFGDAGIKVYGARTLSDNPEWKYINVRRLFLEVQKVIQKGTEWAVFEPNNTTLWVSIKRNISGYLKSLWEKEALVGGTPDEAFYVICDKSNNPQEEIDKGYLNIDIGISPIKPAEFININIQQKIEEE